MIHASYDCIIVGAGISGLYSALQLQKKHPEWTIAIVEKYKGVGGRTYSYSPPEYPGVRWEMGAGRISRAHKLTLRLVEKYGLSVFPLGEFIGFKKNSRSEILPNPFESSFISMYIAPLGMLPENVLKTHTLYELMVDVYGQMRAEEILETFPYWSEVHVLRADLALKTFLDGEMSSHKGYFGVKEGFSELISRMLNAFLKAGGVLLNRQTVLGIRRSGETAYQTDLDIEFGRKKDKIHGRITLRALQCCIFALHADALRGIKGFEKMEALDHVKTEPLLRIYAVFKDAWFADVGRIVTPGRIRYIIPINPSKGVVMISYTDGKDTEAYHMAEKKGILEKVVMKDIRALFPEKDISDPLLMKSHYWETGATYWTKGEYDVEKMSLESCRPLKELKGVFVCGESFSLKQAWIEGALEQTDACLGHI
jgi:hypothetical protein